MKFQPLILPLGLWILVGIEMVFFVPNTPLVIGGMVLLISLASFFSLRLITKRQRPLIITCCIAAFLLSSVLSGFNLVNLLLISAIGILLSQLTTNHP